MRTPIKLQSTGLNIHDPNSVNILKVADNATVAERSIFIHLAGKSYIHDLPHNRELLDALAECHNVVLNIVEEE